MWFTCPLILALGACAPVAQLDPATQAKLDKVIAMAEEHATEPGERTPTEPGDDDDDEVPPTMDQMLSARVSCDAVAQQKARVQTWIVRAEDGEEGERLREAEMACPDEAVIGVAGPGEFIAVVHYEVGDPGGPMGWSVDWRVMRFGPPMEEQLVKRTWKSGPSEPKGHASWKVTLKTVEGAAPPPAAPGDYE